MVDLFAPSASPPEVLCSSIPYHIQNNVHKIATVMMKKKRKSPSPPAIPSQYNSVNCFQQVRVCSQKSRFPSESESCTSASSSSYSSLPSSISSLSPSPSPSSSKVSVEIGRRTMLLAGLLFSYAVSRAEDALAVKQILLAGRVPGLSPPDENGLRTYRRPDEKSGGHGVGWSPIIPYSFKVPDDWEEVPVSIADLGGTEIDLRFSNQKEGNLSVVVAPVLRFSSDLGDNATIEKVGPPEKVIDAFGPEVVGQNVEGQVTDMEVSEFDGRTYYFYELKVPHVLITATAAGNRLYLMTVSANARQWKKYSAELKQIAGSFRVG